MITMFMSFYKPPTYSLIAPQNVAGLGQGKFVSERRWDRPVHDFAFDFDVQNDEMVKDMVAMIHYSQGDMEYWFDGCDLVDSDILRTVAVADGRTQYALPHRNVFAPSLIMYVNGGINSSWTLDENEGVVTFTSAPASGALIEAKYFNKFIVKILSQNEELVSVTDLFKGYDMKTVHLRESI